VETSSASRRLDVSTLPSLVESTTCVACTALPSSTGRSAPRVLVMGFFKFRVSWSGSMDSFINETIPITSAESEGETTLLEYIRSEISEARPNLQYADQDIQSIKDGSGSNKTRIAALPVSLFFESIKEICLSQTDRTAEKLDKPNKSTFNAATKVRAVATCDSCGAKRAVYSKNAVGQKGGPTKRQLENVETLLECGYVCGNPLGEGSGFLMRRALKGTTLRRTFPKCLTLEPIMKTQSFSCHCLILL
ncbi:hypothetical protein THAOC_33939, partial [Thalassiosira oceanica]